MCPGTDAEGCSGESLPLLYLIKSRCCGYFKSNQEGVVGGRIREDQRRKEDENDFQQSHFFHKQLFYFAPFLTILGTAKQPEGLQLHYYFSSFYNLLDFLKIQAAFLPQSGVSAALCPCEQT